MYAFYKVIVSEKPPGVLVPLTKAFCEISRSRSHRLCHGLGWNVSALHLAQFIIIKVSALYINRDPCTWSRLFGICCYRSECSTNKHLLQSSGGNGRGWRDFTGRVIYYWDASQVSRVHPWEEGRQRWDVSGSLEGQERFPSVTMFLSWFGLSPLGKPSIFQVPNKGLRNAPWGL